MERGNTGSGSPVFKQPGCATGTPLPVTDPSRIREKADWSNAEFWLRRQTSYELARAREHQDQIQVEIYKPQPAA